MTNFGFSSTALDVAAHYKDQIRDKTVLITGITPSSLGCAAATAIASGSPNILILASRTPSNITDVQLALQKSYPGVSTRLLKLDLSSFAEIRDAVNEVDAYPERLVDVLINNAGVMVTPYRKTVDGFEMQFATNHVGHFVFTNLLFKTGALDVSKSRVVNVSGDLHGLCPTIRWDDLGFQDGKVGVYDPWMAYGQSKTANILFSKELARRGVTSFSLHPGVIKTNLGRDVDKETMQVLGERIGNEMGKTGVPMKSLEQGAATHIVAAFDEGIKEQSGAYLRDCQIAETMIPGEVDVGEEAKRLWEITEEMVGEKFDVGTA